MQDVRWWSVAKIVVLQERSHVTGYFMKYVAKVKMVPL
jgi:hypothetical protein